MSGSAGSGGSTVLREFLISLGFQVNRSAANEFRDTVANTTQRVEALATAVQAAAEKVVAFTTQMSEGLERLYFSAQRIGSSTDSIKAFGYAASQMGSSVADASNSLESLAQKIRTNPGYGGMVQGMLGGRANLNDTLGTAKQLGEYFKSVPYYVAALQAQTLGISETLMRSMMSGLDAFSDEYQAKLKAFGVTNEAATESGRKFMIAVRSVGASIDILATKIGAQLADRLVQTFRLFDKFLTDNAATITKALTNLVKILLDTADFIGDVISRLGEAIIGIIHWFEQLDPATQRLIEGLGLLVVAWRVLNSAFLTSPIGLIMAVGTAILLLWDDYNTWKEGGKSLIDWAAWEPAIKSTKEWLNWFSNKLNEGIDLVGGWRNVFAGLLAYVGITWAAGMIAAIGRVGATLTALSAPAWLTFIITRLGGPAAAIAWAMNPSSTNGGPENQNSERFQRELNADRMGADTAVNTNLPPEARALLDTISGPESGGRYNVRWGGTGNPDKTFDDFSKHPNILEPGPAGPSSAAGRYQITGETWREFAPLVGATDFQPSTQDLVAWRLAVDTYRQRTGGDDLLTDLRKNDPRTKMKIVNALRGRWSGINLSPYESKLAQEQGRGPGGGTPDGPVLPPSTPGYDNNGFPLINSAPALGASSSGGATVNQSTTIIVNGAGDPTAAATKVVSAQEKVNQNLARNLPGAVR